MGSKSSLPSNQQLVRRFFFFFFLCDHSVVEISVSVAAAHVFPEMHSVHIHTGLCSVCSLESVFS